nr:ribonuclease HI [Halothermothrix orenii]
MFKIKAVAYVKTPIKNKINQKQISNSSNYYIKLKEELKNKINIYKNNKQLYIIYYDCDTVNSLNNLAIDLVKVKDLKNSKLIIDPVDIRDETPVLDIIPCCDNNGVNFKERDISITREMTKMEPIKVYTDGACSGNPGPGGYAAVILNQGQERVVAGYEDETTNNRMELRAVIEALKEIKEGREVHVYSDSSYIINGMKSWIDDWKKRGWKTSSNKPVSNKDLWLKLDNLSSKFNIKFKKVKGHSGDEYNEKADSLARKQIEENSPE